MPHMDTSDIQGSFDGSDYSDYRYQHVTVAVKVDSTGTDASNIRGVQLHEVEPLKGGGGLANNEVAELTYMESQISLEYEQETADQNVASATEYRGVVGINLRPTADDNPTETAAKVNGQSTFLEDSTTVEANVEAGVRSDVDNRFLHTFRIQGNPAFDDEATGTGGGSAQETLVVERPFRQMVNRGPVFDQTDDLAVIDKLILGDSLLLTGAQIDMYLVWDVAEISDAGRQFSVPQ